MEYTQKQIKPLLEDGTEVFHIKITSDKNETKWLNISKELLIEFYNSLN